MAARAYQTGRLGNQTTMRTRDSKPKGTAAKTPRSNRAGDPNNHDKATLNPSAPSSSSTRSATAPAKQSTPPAASSASSGSTRTSPSNDPRPAPTPAPSVPPEAYINATPRDILAAASAMTERDAREFLLQSLNHHEWWDFNLEQLKFDPQLELWIDLFIRAEKYLGEFSFEQWEFLAAAWHRAAKFAWKEEYEIALRVIENAARHWETATDRRRVRFFLLGRIWFTIRNVAPAYDTLMELINSFTSQPETERDILRRMWHDKDEQAVYDGLPDEITLYRGGISPTMWLGFSYTLELRLATMASQRVDTTVDFEFHAPGQPRVISRRVSKTAIIGVKHGSPYYGDACLDIVAPPCLSGHSMSGI